MSVSAKEARALLEAGNRIYIGSERCSGDISPARRLETAEHGQHPYAIVLCCSDSREIPEAIFSAGIGDLFVIRVAGNVVDSHQLGSIEYAADHLGCKLVLVLGHDSCGAVDAAIHHDPDGHIKFITDEVRKAIGEETDPLKASCLNVRHSVSVIRERLHADFFENTGLEISGAIYHLADGTVEFLEQETI